MAVDIIKLNWMLFHCMSYYIASVDPLFVINSIETPPILPVVYCTSFVVDILCHGQHYLPEHNVTTPFISVPVLKPICVYV